MDRVGELTASSLLVAVVASAPRRLIRTPTTVMILTEPALEAKRPYGWHSIADTYAKSQSCCADQVKECPRVVPSTEVPRQVRLVGLLVGLQGLAGVAFAIALVVRGASGVRGSQNDFGEAGYFGLLSIGLIAVCVGLLLGKRWAFAPAAVVQVLLLGVAWYAVVGAARLEIGLPLGVLVIAALVLLFMPASRAWRLGADQSEGS